MAARAVNWDRVYEVYRWWVNDAGGNPSRTREHPYKMGSAEFALLDQIIDKHGTGWRVPHEYRERQVSGAPRGDLNGFNPSANGMPGYDPGLGRTNYEVNHGIWTYDSPFRTTGGHGNERRLSDYTPDEQSSDSGGGGGSSGGGEEGEVTGGVQWTPEDNVTGEGTGGEDSRNEAGRTKQENNAIYLNRNGRDSEDIVKDLLGGKPPTAENLAPIRNDLMRHGIGYTEDDGGILIHLNDGSTARMDDNHTYSYVSYGGNGLARPGTRANPGASEGQIPGYTGSRAAPTHDPDRVNTGQRAEFLGDVGLSDEDPFDLDMHNLFAAGQKQALDAANRARMKASHGGRQGTIRGGFGGGSPATKRAVLKGDGKTPDIGGTKPATPDAPKPKPVRATEQQTIVGA